MKYTVWENDIDLRRKVAEFDSLDRATDCAKINRGLGFNVFVKDENGETVCPTYKHNATSFLSH